MELKVNNRLKDRSFWCGRGGFVCVCLSVSLLAAFILLIVTTAFVSQPVLGERVVVDGIDYQKSTCEIAKADFLQEEDPSECGTGYFKCLRVSVRLHINGSTCDTVLFHDKSQTNRQECSYVPCAQNMDQHEKALQDVFSRSLVNKNPTTCYYVVDNNREKLMYGNKCNFAYLYLPGERPIGHGESIASIAVPTAFFLIVFVLFTSNLFICACTKHDTIFHLCRIPCSKRPANSRRRHISTITAPGMSFLPANGMSPPSHGGPDPPTYTEHDNQGIPEPPPPYDEDNITNDN